jgi:site-specific DNA recombinase
VLTVIGYTRCSTEEQHREGLSLEAQRERIELWSEAAGANLAGVIEDGGVPGSRPLAVRPGGQHITALLEQREPAVDALAITSLDRLGRDAAETLAYLRRFAQGKLGLVSILDRLDLTTPQGRALAGVAAVFSQLERELVGARTSEALASLRRKGRVYGPLPYGFDREGDLLVENFEEGRVASQMIDMREAGLSYRAIASWLNSEEIPAKRGGIWNAPKVRSVVQTTTSRTGGSP